jgi:GNAT superfamily N-acetyltransferase
MPENIYELSGQIKFRKFHETDSISEVTSLLNLAYKPLAENGFQYLASTQDNTITLQRIQDGQCYVAMLEEQLIGTLTYYDPSTCKGCNWYDNEFVASFGQFAVHPRHQGKGIGSEMIVTIERIAKMDGARELAVDTAEGVSVLIDFYKKRGYRFIEYADWDVTNYRSVILSKRIL